MREAKEFLLSLTYQKYKVEQAAADILEAENDAYGLSAITISERVQTSPAPEWIMSAAVEEVERLKKKYEDEMAKYIQIRREVKEAVRALPDKRFSDVLEMRYCRFMKLSQIAERIDRNEGYVRRLHGEALESFRRVHNMK